MNRGAAGVRFVVAGLLLGTIALVGAAPASADVGDITTYDDPEGEVHQPTDIVAGPDGNVWFVQQGSGFVARTTPAGVITTFPLPGGANGAGLTVGADGNLWTAQPSADALVRITPAGVATAFTDVEDEVDLPVDVALGPDGNVWFVSFLDGRVGYVTPAGAITTFEDLADPLEDPGSIALGPDGNLWVGHGPENLIGLLAKVTTAGDVVPVPIPDDVDRVGDLVTGPDGNVWFTDPAEDRVGRVTPAGVVTMFEDADGDVDQPEGIAAGPDSNVWFASSANDRIGRISPTGAITTFEDPSGQLDRPFGIAAGPGAAADVWFTQLDVDQVGRIQPTQVADAPVATATPGDAVVSLSWTAPADTGGLPVTSYVVRRNGTQVHETADGFATSFTDQTVTNGTAYEYEVAAVNARGVGTPDVVAVTPRTVPGAPGGLTVTDDPDPGELRLSWTAPAANGGSTVLRYRIYRDGVLAHTTPAAATSFTDTGRTNRRVHRYEVAAVNLVGTGQRSTAASGAAEYDCPADEPAFEDVAESHQFYGDTCWMAEEEVSTGFPDGTYRPSIAVSRGAMSAFMFRLAGVTGFDPPSSPTFDDVSPSHQFFDEVEWMAAEHITTGHPDGTFRPSAAVSRGAMSAFLYRLAGSPLAPAPATPSFEDVATGYAFYAEVEWMAAENITTGNADGTFRPGSSVSRQSMSAFMHRLADGPGVDI
jgi:streptogramin lyase